MPVTMMTSGLGFLEIPPGSSPAARVRNFYTGEVVSSPASFPTIGISRRAAERLRSGHLWVYQSDIERVSAPEPLHPGALVNVAVAHTALGTALWSTASQIAARLVSTQADLPREGYLQLVRERLRRALKLRSALSPVNATDNAHRILFSEADGLPGIIVDRYNDLVVVQLLIQGTAKDDVRAVVREVLEAEFSAKGEPLTIWERRDPRIARLEDLGEPEQAEAHAGAQLLYTSASDEAPSTTSFNLNGLRFGYDAGAGQKTGAFLDQRLNYKAAAAWAGRLLRGAGRPGRALDVCTYHGGFALHLAQVCERVTGVDASRAALEAADRNLERNLDGPLGAPPAGGDTPDSDLPVRKAGRVDWMEADGFELLRALDEARVSNARPPSSVSTARGRARTAAAELPAGLAGRYDVIVLDPPAFTKSRSRAADALRGYKELNLRALRLLERDGLLVTCSCSHHVSAEDFREVVRSAAQDAGRTMQVLESRGAAPDHPEVLALPETRYLKCLLCRVE